jgi:hypothetical protein
MKSVSYEQQDFSKIQQIILHVFVLLAITACGDKPQSPAPQAAPLKLFEQDRAALEKAKGVEQTQAQSAEALKREEEKQTK